MNTPTVLNVGADLVALSRLGYSVGIAPEANPVTAAPVQAAVVFQREGQRPLIYTCSLVDPDALARLVHEFRAQISP